MLKIYSNVKNISRLFTYLQKMTAVCLPDTTHNKFADIFPLEISGAIMDNGDSDSSLQTMMEEIDTTTWKIITVVNHHWNVFTAAGCNQKMHQNISETIKNGKSTYLAQGLQTTLKGHAWHVPTQLLYSTDHPKSLNLLYFVNPELLPTSCTWHS